MGAYDDDGLPGDSFCTRQATKYTRPAVNEKLKNDTNKAIGEYFKGGTSQLFPNKTCDENLRRSILAIIPRMIVISPAREGTLDKIKYSFCEDASSSDVKRALRVLAGDDYIEETDLFREEDLIINPERLRKLIPEMRGLEELFAVNYNIAPKYLAVLSMPPELRDLPAMALFKRDNNNNNYNGNDNTFNTNGNNTYMPFTTFLNKCIPTLVEIVAVAKDYGITEIKSTLEDLERVTTIYEKAWKKQN